MKKRRTDPGKRAASPAPTASRRKPSPSAKPAAQLAVALDSFHSAVIAISVDAIISVDERQRIILFNRGAELMFGYAAEEIIGRPLDALIPEDVRGRHRGHVEEFGRSDVAARRMHERGGIIGRRKSGERFPAEASISHVEAGGRRVYTAVVRDMTERHRVEQERTRLLEAERRAREAAEEATRARDIVLAVVSHDLRQPLSAISMISGALAQQGDLKPELRQELAGSIGQSVQWMHRMLEDLLDASNIEAGRLSLELHEEDPADLIARALALLKPVADEAQLRLEAFVEPRLPRLAVDAQRLIQALTNLGVNSCKFTPAGGRVVLRASRVPDGVRFEVEDTGRGIAESDLPHVFNRFWQRRGAAKRGTGLGLAIARGIVEAHEGRVEVASTVGHGSTFALVLPVPRGAVKR